MGVTAPEQVSSLPERLRVAHRALATAEAAAGLRVALPGDSAASSAGRVGAAPVVSDRFLPVPDALVPLVPFGGLRRGSAVRVEGSSSLLLALAAAACREGAWCAVVGMPDLGLAAAAEYGLPLDRVALVPAPGADTPAVLGAAIDGFDVIMLGDVPHLVERDRRHLASRLRHREAVLLTPCPWPGVEMVMSVTESRWGGIGQGHGALRGRDLTVRIGGRGAAGGLGVQGRFRSPDGVRFVPVLGAEAAAAGSDGDGVESRTGVGVEALVGGRKRAG